jgi:2-oxoglutarate dehydrogenase E1 component
MTNNVAAGEAALAVSPGCVSSSGWSVDDAVLHGRIQALVDAYRAHGYRGACADPLHLAPLAPIPELTLEFHGLTSQQVLQPYAAGFPEAFTAGALKQQLSSVYCGTLSLDCSGVRSDERRRWLHARMEASLRASPLGEDRRRALLRRLIDAQSWEHRVAQSLPHAKRFSLEGCESLIPLLDALVEQGARHGVDQVFIGMPHRGRLNVLVNVMGMDAQTMLARLDDESAVAMAQRDLAYHLGTSVRRRFSGRDVGLTLAHNPSHLQSVHPVVSGMVRAYRDEHPGSPCMALMVHGDAAFAGQGIVSETLNLTRHAGYSVGGTVHVIVNNQIGFTTLNTMAPHEHRYCTDVARIVDAPVLRVNADDPEAVLRAAAIAVEYRAAHAADIVIDLVGYRRLGHSEHDIPSIAQPALQARVAEQSSVVHRYHARIKEPESLDALYARALRAPSSAAAETASSGPLPLPGTSEKRSVPREPVSVQRLRALGAVLTTAPGHMKLHERLEAQLGRWREALQGGVSGIDWCLAENLAHAVVLDDGGGVRISGMDVGRGTFMHRHAVWRSQSPDEDGAASYVPLRHLSPQQGPIDIIDSPLTEEAVLGFEYGYSVQSRTRLPIWEAQYGDFANGAQVFIDQYIASGEYKWGYRSALTVLLPHGHEGVGPEHSSGYLSRFLQLCAGENLRVVMPSTSSQWFHLLREQACAEAPRPLIVMSPKAQLYAHSGSHAPLQAFVASSFASVIDDPGMADRAACERVTRVVLCSGKLFYELLADREEYGAGTTALLRVEQLYPFPEQAIAAALSRYPNLETIVWAQEEEKNHGAWHFVREPLESILPAHCRLACVCRDATPSGAHASMQLHRQAQQRLRAAALNLEDAYAV